MTTRAIALITVLAACGHTTDGGRDDRAPRIVHHITSPADVRWPLERRSFAGTIRHASVPGRDAPVVMLALERDPLLPPSIVLPTEIVLDLPVEAAPAGQPLVVSGIGRRLADDEAAAGAFLALRDVQIGTRAAHAGRDPRTPETWRDLRSRTEVGIAVRQTHAIAHGRLIERDGRELLLELSPGAHVRVMVVVEGVDEARARVGSLVRAEGSLWLDEAPPTNDVIPSLALGQPRFW